jgi:hypothetical protein
VLDVVDPGCLPGCNMESRCTLGWAVAQAGLDERLQQNSHQKSCRPVLSPYSCPWFQRRPSKLLLLLVQLPLLLPQLRPRVL